MIAVQVPDAIREVALREARIEAADAAEAHASVGEFIAAHEGEDGLVTVRFAASVEGYRGWEWSVTVAVIDPVHPTVSEVVLLPGPEALVAPAWVPWKERIRGGDLAPGDLLPPPPDDIRIVPAYVQSDDPAVEELAFEVGVGRERVLSREGRAQAGKRWHGGDFGPRSEMARLAPGTCSTCAFYIPVAGALGAGFGVCGNEFSPADGHVVDLAFGCGAHSEVRAEVSSREITHDAVLDELALEVHVREEDAEEAAAGLDGESADAGDLVEDVAEAADSEDARADGLDADTGTPGADADAEDVSAHDPADAAPAEGAAGVAVEASAEGDVINLGDAPAETPPDGE